MLVPICVKQQQDGRLIATVPDMPGVSASGSELGRTLTRIHLKLEGYISELLLADQPVPEVRTLAQVRGMDSVTECYEIHINLTHLRAVAKHQWGR